MNTQNALSVLRNTMKKQWLLVSFFAVITFLVVVLMTGVTMFTNRVYITDGEDVKCVLTTETDIDKVLSENKYKIGKDDIVDFKGFENNTGKVNIARAFNVKLTADGKTLDIPIARGTVADILTKATVTVSDNDLMNIGLTEAVNANTNIVIQRVTFDEVTAESAIAFQTTNTNSSKKLKGTETVTTAGQEGVLSTVTKNTYIDGVVTTSEVLSQTVIKEPVTKVITVGTAYRSTVSQIAPESFTVDANGIPVSYSKVLTGRSAAYSANPGARTASGRPAVVGNVAVNPNIIPYGTKLYITSADGKHVYGYAVAADTGGALASGRIMVDLFMATTAECNRWGIQTVNIYILK